MTSLGDKAGDGGLMSYLGRLKKLDVYRKIPKGYTESTFCGACGKNSPNDVITHSLDNQYHGYDNLVPERIEQLHGVADNLGDVY